jgi:hypothetical protein
VPDSPRVPLQLEVSAQRVPRAQQLEVSALRVPDSPRVRVQPEVSVPWARQLGVSARRARVLPAPLVRARARALSEPA